MLKQAGYATGVVGKWHLGLGAARSRLERRRSSPARWRSASTTPSSIPATGDRVPCVYRGEPPRRRTSTPKTRSGSSYDQPIGDEPTGKANPELLKMHPSHGHDKTIVNGISRIGYMTGGKAARWVDEDMADTLTGKAVSFIEQHEARPFFLYFATHDIHVPRVPAPALRGQDRDGPARRRHRRTGLVRRRAFSTRSTASSSPATRCSSSPATTARSWTTATATRPSRNWAITSPAGPLRGGKYSTYEGGTRVPFIVRWPGTVKPGVSAAALSQVDLLSSFAALAGCKLPEDAAPDSFNLLPVLLGKSRDGRPHIVEHATALSLIVGDWKVIQAHNGPKRNQTGNEIGNDPQPQLFNLVNDLAERNNVAAQYPGKVKEMLAMLAQIQQDGRSRPR